MSLVDYIKYEMHSRGSLPTLYSLEGRVTGRFRSRSIRLYGKYLQGIRYLLYPNRSFFIAKMSSDCLAVHAKQRRAHLDLVGRATSDGAAHVLS